MTPSAELKLLRAVRAGNVTWNRKSWRHWTDEVNYIVVTKDMPSLEQQGLVERHMEAGYRYVQRGPVELTPAGRWRLNDLTEAQP